MKLILIRGITGSGKTTYAKKLIGQYPMSNVPAHYEADMYFITKEGEYKWDSSRVRDAHQWCKESTEYTMKQGGKDVIVSNTFTKLWEMDDYSALAVKYNKYDIVVYRMLNEYGSIHNVPEETIIKMRDRMESMYGEIWVE